MCAVVGRSGSGKTTLLNLIGGLDKPDAGRIAVDGRQLAGPGRGLSESELARLRRDLFGFVFQSFALIPILSAAENVGIPLRLRRTPVPEREERVELLLKMVGLGEHIKQRPGEMSGGQQQRVALARALANSPRVLIADEPTGQLDSETGRAVMRLLRAVVAAENVTALVATHDPLMMELADRVITVGDGSCSRTPTPRARASEARAPARRGSGLGLTTVSRIRDSQTPDPSADPEARSGPAMASFRATPMREHRRPTGPRSEPHGTGERPPAACLRPQDGGAPVTSWR